MPAIPLPIVEEQKPGGLPPQAHPSAPILLGRLKRVGDRYSILGHAGDVRAISAGRFEILRRMTGFAEVTQIAEQANTTVDEVESTFQDLRGEKRLSTLGEWNQTAWCDHCAIYLTRTLRCPECFALAKKTPLLPPCDPWILFAEEYSFVRSLLMDRAGIEIDAQRLLLGNNGVFEGRFFWQVLYYGRVVLTIYFRGAEPSDWEVVVSDAAHEVDWHAAFGERNSGVKRLVRVNQAAMSSLERDSIAFIDEVCEIYPTDPLLYFSGGKESVVMLRLLEKAGRRANLAFVGTGADFPEDADFLLTQLKPEIDRNPLFRLQVNIAQADEFLDALREEGGLDARNAWCRKRIKVPLKAAITDRLYGGANFVAFEGSRWYENDFRRSHPRLNYIREYERQIWAHPLAPWTGLEIWLYIWSEDLKVNPMYFRGYQRTTCWLCPIVNPFHLHMSKKQYPELWAGIRGIRLKGFDGDDILNTPF